VVDGIGARLALRPVAYSLWLFVGIALVLPPYALWRDGRAVIPAMRRYWLRGFAGGGLQVISYGTALWAMTLAPIAIVATLREISVLFGAILAVTVLKEPLRPIRIVAALLILSGLMLLRL
jgi:drug/metabolite transporter (DMT)-like permease